MVGKVRERRPKAGAWRFDDHALLAVAIYLLRNPTTNAIDAEREVCAALCRQATKLAAHTDAAETSGVLTGVQDGGRTRITWPALLDGMSQDQRTAFVTGCEYSRGCHKAGLPTKWNTVAEVMQELAKARGFYSILGLAQATGVIRGKTNERAIVMAASADFRSRGAEALELEGLRIVRGPEKPMQFLRVEHID
jgi:hypothetical protein